MRWPVTSNPRSSRRVNALRSGRSKIVLDMSRSFGWTVSEPPSSKDLDPYPATTRPTPPTTPTPSIMKSPITLTPPAQRRLADTQHAAGLGRTHALTSQRLGLLQLHNNLLRRVLRELPHGHPFCPATSSRDYSEQPSHNKRSKTQTPPHLSAPRRAQGGASTVSIPRAEAQDAYASDQILLLHVLHGEPTKRNAPIEGDKTVEQSSSDSDGGRHARDC